MSLFSSSRLRVVIELRRGKARNMGTCPTRSSEAVDIVCIASITGSPHALANSAKTVAELVPADRCNRHYVSSMRIRLPSDSRVDPAF
jgi:hypothetical protein